MHRCKESLRGHALAVGLLAVAIPLLASLWLQYQSLSELEVKLPIVRRVYMRRYLYDVLDKVISHYKQKADETLNVPHTAFRHRYPDPEFDINNAMNAEQIATHFQNNQFKGARLLFTGIISGLKEPTTATVKFYHSI